MKTVPEHVLEVFLEKLSERDEITTEQLASLKTLMSEKARLKAKDVEEIFEPKEDIV